MGTQVRFLSIVSILSILLAGCGVGATSAILSSNPEICSLPASTPNPYDVPPEAWVSEPYRYIAATNSQFSEQQYREARYAAFQLLRKQTERWSNSVDISLSNTETVRITITYLSPQLLQLIEVNHVLMARTNLGMGDGDFQNFVRGSLNKAAKLQGMIFMVTVYAAIEPDRQPVAISLPIKKMVLINAENSTVYPIYYDHGLEGTLYLGNSAFSGFVVYPIAVKNSDTCHLVLEDTPDRKITIDMSNIIIEDKDRGNFTWTIRYSPILDDGAPDEKSEFTPSDTWQYSSYVPLSQAPDLYLSSNEYWDAFSCYLWEQVTYNNLP